ncbi:MAG: DNA pilot protein [Microviridae sp.]|nr:MAG: DNA pilot protein [Microviridae sp.]
MGLPMALMSNTGGDTGSGDIATTSGGGMNWGAIGTQGAGEITGGLFSRLFSKFDDDRAYNQAQRLQGLQIQGAETLADYSQQEQMKTWLATNYPAQMQQMGIAGLSPGLMYHGTGPGGQLGGGAVPMPASPDAGSGPARGMAAAAQAGMGLQLAQAGLIKAQTENVQADTAVKEAQAPNVQADTALKGTQIDSLTQGISNQQAVEALTKVQTDLANLQKTITTQSMDDQLEIIAQNANKAKGEAQSALVQGNLDMNTEKTKMGIIEQSYLQLLADTALKQSQTEGQNNQNIVTKLDAAIATAGVSKDSPWYIKLIAPVVDKLKVNPLKP